MDEDHIASLLERLLAVPEQIAGKVAGWDRYQLRDSGPNIWSAAEILAHLRAGEEIITPRIYAMLVRDNPTFLDYDAARWAEVAGYVDARFAPSLTLFRMRRLELVSTLRRLAPADWGRIGTHEIHGPITVQGMVEALAAHEEEHCEQIRALPSPL